MALQITCAGRGGVAFIDAERAWGRWVATAADEASVFDGYRFDLGTPDPVKCRLLTHRGVISAVLVVRIVVDLFAIGEGVDLVEVLGDSGSGGK